MARNEPRLKAKSARSLLVIDDRKLRLKLAAEADGIRKKIETLERDTDNFSSQDQRLFDDWYKLTFRREEQEIEARYQEYNLLAKFHNDIIATSELFGIPTFEAYHRLKEEQRLYETGTANERAKIDRRREQRASHIHDSQHRPHLDDEEDHDPADDEPLWAGGPDLSNFSPEDKKFYQSLTGKSAEKLREYFSGPDAESLAMEAFRFAILCEDALFFVRVWDALSPRTRRTVAKSFAEMRGISLADIVNEMRGEVSDDDEPFHFEDSAGRSQKSRDPLHETRAKKRSAQDQKTEQDVKLSFRRLVRLIHPDSQSPDTDPKLQAWSQKTWHRVQQAYKNKDLQELKKLEALALLHLKELNNLSLDEIKASAEWLEDELLTLQMKVSGLKDHPAWRFSSRRGYDSLIKKIKRDLVRTLGPVLEEIEEMKSLHAHFEQIAKERWSRPPLRKKDPSRARRPRRKRRNTAQMELGPDF